MPLGRLSVRIDDSNDRHHLWLNNGTWWAHYTLNFDVRTRRVRRSLETSSLAEAIRRRDALFARLATEGEWVPERGEEGDMPTLLRLCLAAG
jgi:ligand-binding sensor domain-containing protein